jgi:hypothetical protein
VGDLTYSPTGRGTEEGPAAAGAGAGADAGRGASDDAVGVTGIDAAAGRMMLHSWRLQLQWWGIAALPSSALRSLAKAGVRLPAPGSPADAAPAGESSPGSDTTVRVVPAAGPGSEWVAAGTSAFLAPDPLEVGRPGMEGVEWVDG